MFRLPLVVVALAFLPPLQLVAFPLGPAPQGKGGGKDSSEKAKKTANEKYAVVRIGDNVRMVKLAELADLRKEVDDKFKRDLERWDEAKKSAEKEKKKFTRPKPVKQQVKVLASNLAGEEAAKKKKDEFEKSIEEEQKASAEAAKKKAAEKKDAKPEGGKPERKAEKPDGKAEKGAQGPGKQ